MKWKSAWYGPVFDEGLFVTLQGMETALNFVTTHVIPRSVEYATRDVIWEPIVELQNLLQGHYYGHPVYK